MDEDEASPLQTKKITKKDDSKWTFWLVYSTVVCVGGSSFQFGYNTSCINSPETIIKAFYRKHGHFTDFEWAVVVSIFAVGGMLGAIIGAYLASQFGRKKTLLVNNITAFIGVLFIFISYETKEPALLMVGRFIIGVNSGINTSVVPMYLSEIAPISLRGAIGTMNQFGIIAGLLTGFVFGLKEVLGNESGWPLLMCFSIVPATIQAVTLPCSPRSPRYLLLKLNHEASAVYALQVLRGTTDVSEDIAEMRSEQEAAILEQGVSIREMFTMKDLRMPLLIAVVLQCSQQLSGINAVFYYSTSTFDKAHVPGSQYATVAVGVVSIIMSAITVSIYVSSSW
ncbi:hypothetical protein QZH41_010372 [Actinostola sp. cb2023]|nr:hypothetical protein QZH41_010372 [Actinostola sp. cb2023]